MDTVNSENLNQRIDTSKDSFPIRKNFYVLCFAIFICSNAIYAVNSLQSSVNFDHGLGVTSTSIQYGVAVMSNWFWTSIIIRWLGLKYTIVLGIAIQSTYILSNVYPAWYTMVPTAVLTGMFTSSIWPAKSAYITHLGSLCDIKDHRKSESTVRFFGIYCLFFYGSTVLGTLFSYFVLEVHEETVQVSEFCGSKFCDSLVSKNDTNFAPISTAKRFLLFGGFFGIVVVAVLLAAFFLDQVRLGPPLTLAEYARLSLGTIRQFVNKNHFLLSFSNLYRGLSGSFITADFTKAFMTCAFSVENVGFVVMAFGGCCGLSSLLLSRLVKYTGRLPIFIFSVSTHALLISAMLTWMSDPQDHTTYTYIIMAALWGVGHSVLDFQISALYSLLFPESLDRAFPIFQSVDDMGKSISYALSSVICFSTKLYLLSTFLGLATIGYVIVEIPLFLLDRKLLRKGKQTTDSTSH